jgi:phage gpG-like protein
MATATVEQQWNGTEVKLRGKRVVGKSAFEIGLIVEGQAKLLINNVTGRLAGSITTASRDTQSGVDAPAGFADLIRPPVAENEVFVGTGVEYGPYVEFGTFRTNARPFLRPALDLAQGKALTIVMSNGRFEFREYLK